MNDPYSPMCDQGNHSDMLTKGNGRGQGTAAGGLCDQGTGIEPCETKGTLYSMLYGLYLVTM